MTPEQQQERAISMAVRFGILLDSLIKEFDLANPKGLTDLANLLRFAADRVEKDLAEDLEKEESKP